MNPIKSEQIEWIQNNIWIFEGINRTPTKEQIAKIFEILSTGTGKEQKPSGCGRCIINAKNQVWAQYKKQKQK